MEQQRYPLDNFFHLSDQKASQLFVLISTNIIIKLMSYFEILSESQVMQPIKARGRRYSLHVKTNRPKSQLEDYQLKQSIGQGGYGHVFKAIHRPTGETVAVKILKVDDCDPEQIISIQDEITLHQKLMHEHIAQIYEVVRRANKIYIFMEYCPNGELFDYIIKNGPMTERETARIFNQILSALLYLKGLGISHRDIKPENILFDQEWNVKLVDFGFSCKQLSQEEIFRKTVCGTPSYTPPEILLQTSYSAELMDVWSLGVTIYAMLAAELPFQSENNEKRRARIITCKWTPKPFFSSRVNKLLSSMLVTSTARANLGELQASEFLMNHQFKSADFIDFKKESIVPEQSILSLLQKQFRMEKRHVVDSVKGYKLDKYHAAYYLILKREIEVRKKSGDVNISKYRKQRTSSLLKLEPIIRTPLSRHKEQDPLKSLKLDLDSGRCRSLYPQHLVLSSCRIRSETPDNSLRLIDCLASYKGE